jgi:hypothetical protein
VGASWVGVEDMPVEVEDMRAGVGVEDIPAGVGVEDIPAGVGTGPCPGPSPFVQACARRALAKTAPAAFVRPIERTIPTHRAPVVWLWFAETHRL